MNTKQFEDKYLGVAVHCPTRKLAEEFCKMAEQSGYHWSGHSNGKSLAKRSFFLGSDMCYRLIPENKEVRYGSVKSYESADVLVVEFESLEV